MNSSENLLQCMQTKGYDTQQNIFAQKPYLVILKHVKLYMVSYALKGLLRMLWRKMDMEKC